MPYVTNGNIYAPVMMLAEKAADLILGNTPLAPSDAQFYRHTKSSALSERRPATRPPTVAGRRFSGTASSAEDDGAACR